MTGSAPLESIAPQRDVRPYIIRTYDRWIILVLVLVVGWLIFRPVIAFTVYYRGVNFERTFRLSDAEYYYKKATRVDPKVPQGWLAWGELERMNVADPVARKETIRIFSDGLSYSPTYAPLAFDLGRAYFTDKQYAKAREAFLQSARYAPNDAFSWDFAAWSALHAGNRSSAIEYWHRVLTIDPGNATARRMLNQLGG
jgi:tetratricopeptide (TPR) repeat protein